MAAADEVENDGKVVVAAAAATSTGVGPLEKP